MSIKGIEPKKLKKVIEAEELCSTLDNTNILKALSIYKDLCFQTTLSPEDKIEVLCSFLKNIPDEGREMLIRIRDMIAYLGSRDLDNMIRLCVLICENPSIDSHERSVTAITLYNHAFLNVCFRCFEAIATDKSVLVTYRIDACRYLVGSEIPENREIAQECLLEIIEDQNLMSDFRYKIIAGFISRTGISTFLNSAKIKIPYDEEFVYGLQTSFFSNKENGIRERLLSAQHLLGISEELSTIQEKTDISTELLEIAKNGTYDENTRADAADIVLTRSSNDEHIAEARKIIADIGYSGVSGKSTSLMDRVKTLYNNSQNIHDETIAESVGKFIEKMVRDTKTKTRPFHEVQNEVVELIKTKDLTSQQRHNAYKALNRVSIDVATFTSYRVTISDIFVRVWFRINKEEDPTNRALLENRLIEELIEMGDTCSSGHGGRFVNVLSAVDSDIKISFESQINSNLAGRINKRLRDIENSDLRASISSGMLPDAEEEDKDAYKTFIENVLPELYSELQKEFVGEKYISQEEFDLYFIQSKKQWLDYLR